MGELHERNVLKTSETAVDARKCCNTQKNTLFWSSIKQREGVGFFHLGVPLLEGDESGAVGGTNTGPTVLYRLVGDGELSQVVSNHLWLHLNLCEDLAVVNSNNGASHLRDNDHVPQASLDHIGLLVGRSLLLLLPQLLDQGHWLPLESPGELPPDPPMLQLDISVSHDCFSCTH